MVRDPCNPYTKEPFPQSHAGEQYTVSSRRSLSLSGSSVHVNLWTIRVQGAWDTSIVRPQDVAF